MAVFVQAWILLKYKPNRYWFEIPFLAYKCIAISAGELLDSGTVGDTKMLLGVLSANTFAMLILVLIDKPFRGEHTELSELTGGDKSQVVSLLSMLANFGIGWWCWYNTSDRELTSSEELMANMGGLICVCLPLLYMILQNRKDKKQSKGQNAQVKYENPLMLPDEEKDGDQDRQIQEGEKKESKGK